MLLSFVCRTEKSWSVFDVRGSWKRRGPGDYVLFPNEKGEDEGGGWRGDDQEGFLGFHSDILDGGSLI